MSKIWVNGQEIDLAKLTAEQISALTESDNHDYNNPNGVYLNETLSGDGSFDMPYGVAKLPNPLVVSVVGGNGEVSKSVFDGTQELEVKLDNYKDVVDNNTIVGNGTEKSPLKVSDNLLGAIDSAYTTSIQTAFLLDDMQRQIDDMEIYHDEISAKCDYAVEVSLLSNMIAESAMSIALSASSDVDKLYDFISTLIYDITYDDLTNNLIITYVDGSQSYVKINDITILEQQALSLSAQVENLNEIVLTLKQFITNVEYNSDNSSIVVTYADNSKKVIVVNDIVYIKQTLVEQQSAITNNTNNITNLQKDVTNLTLNQSATNETIINIIDVCNEQTSAITDLDVRVDDIEGKLPNAISSVTYSHEDKTDNKLTFTTIGDKQIVVDLSGITENREIIDDSVKGVSFDDKNSILTIVYNNGTQERFTILNNAESGATTTIYFGVMPHTELTPITINGKEVEVFNDGDTIKQYPIQVTGNSVSIDGISETDKPIVGINLNGMILNTSDLNEVANLQNVEHGILPSNCSEMFINDISLVSVNCNTEFLINGERMFENCSALTGFNSSLKTLIIGNSMFKNNSSLFSISNNMPMLREGNDMFYNCDSLKSVSYLNLKRLEDGTNMFADCDNLTNVLNIKLDKLKVGSSMFSGDAKLTTSNISTPMLVSGDNMYNGCNFAFYNTSLANLENGSSMFSNNKRLVTFMCNDLYKLENGTNMFAECSTLKRFTQSGDSLNNLRVADNMFANATSLTTFSAYQLTNLLSATSMFNGCESLSSFTLNKEADNKSNGLTNLTNADYMFSGCVELTKVLVKKLDSLQTAQGMFGKCKELPTWKIDMVNLINGANMFEDCIKLSAVSADIRSLSDANNMFKGCTALESVILATDKLQHTTDMFNGCTALSEVKISGLGCSLDLSETKLNVESLLFIAENAKNVRGKVVSLTITTIDVPTEQEEDYNNAKQILNTKGWQLIIK